VPLELVRFPTVDDPAGTNTVEIAIDAANTGGDVWVVEADWLELRLGVDAPPLGVAHGLGDGDATMQVMADWFRDDVEALDAKLISAAAAFERGNDGAACNKLGAFVNELEAQRDQHLDVAAHDRLRPLIDRLRAQRCPPA
jgi:hypothetical protein